MQQKFRTAVLSGLIIHTNLLRTLNKLVAASKYRPLSSKQVYGLSIYVSADASRTDDAYQLICLLLIF